MIVSSQSLHSTCLDYCVRKAICGVVYYRLLENWRLNFILGEWICATCCDMAVGVCSFEQNEVNAIAILGSYVFIMSGTQPREWSVHVQHRLSHFR